MGALFHARHEAYIAALRETAVPGGNGCCFMPRHEAYIAAHTRGARKARHEAYIAALLIAATWECTARADPLAAYVISQEG